MNPLLETLRRALDSKIVGQDDAKRALLLGLIARQHVYLEGPPGCGKSALGRALASACAAATVEIRFHRDTRDSDLLGDAVIERETMEGGCAGERIRRRIQAGPLLSAEVAILDDLSRAPGEALGTLLRILSERKALGRALPLECAIATAPPADAPDVYADPLEPNQLDRFALQLRVGGVLQGGDHPRSRKIIEQTLSDRGRSTGSGNEIENSGITAAQRASLQSAADALAIPDATRVAWLRLLQRLVALGEREGGVSLSDRAFAAAAPSLLRAHALLRGADEVSPRDLRVLRYMVARRIPERLIQALDGLIDEISEESETQATRGEAVEGDAVVVEGDEAEGGGTPDADAAAQNRKGGDGEGDEAHESPPALPDAEVDELLRVLRGRLDRGELEREEHPGGAPRRLQTMRRFDEILDADPVEVGLLVEGALAGMPRSLRREKAMRGGALVLVRDISASMAGQFARWSGAVVAGLVRAGARRRMRVGYVEFNHEAKPLLDGGALLHRQYREILGQAAQSRAMGRTNYEAPLRVALEALGEHRGSNRHLVMVTDGVPVLGDPVVENERAVARALGARIHTVFLGKGECPKILDDISLETGGMRFHAVPDVTGRIHVTERRRSHRAA